MIHGELGESLIDFDKPKISNKNAIEEALSKIDISGDFLKQHHLRYAMTDYAKQKERNAKKEKTTGKKWYSFYYLRMNVELEAREILTLRTGLRLFFN